MPRYPVSVTVAPLTLIVPSFRVAWASPRSPTSNPLQVSVASERMDTFPLPPNPASRLPESVSADPAPVSSSAPVALQPILALPAETRAPPLIVAVPKLVAE